MKKPTAKQEIFCQHVISGKTEIDSYVLAYQPKITDRKKLSRLASSVRLSKPVDKRIVELRAPVIKEAQIEITDVLKKWVAIAMADPNDIVQHRRICCRFCYGIGHKYQWTDGELAMAIAHVMTENAKLPDKKQLSLPDVTGGTGFDPNKLPLKNCPTCFGNGMAEIFFNDTRTLTDNAKCLYAGVKNGEVILHDQAQALENIAKYLGMFKVRIEKDVPPAPPTEIPKKFSEMTKDPIEAARAYQKFITGG